MPKKPCKTPKFDSEVKALRERVLRTFQLDCLGKQLLEHALDAFRRMLQARSILDLEGLITHDRFGQAKSHPAFEQEQVSRMQFLRHVRALGLDPGEFESEVEQ